MPVFQAAFSPKMGALSDRIGVTKLASGGMGLFAVSLFLLSRLNAASSFLYVIIALVIAGMGFAMFSSPNNNAIMSSVSPADFGVTNSVIVTMRNYGQSSGLAIFNVVIILGNGLLEAANKQEISTLMHISFMAFAVISLIGLLCSLARDKKYIL